MNSEDNKHKPGPDPETLKIEEGEVNWKDALRHAMSKPKPKREEVEGEADDKEKDQQG